MEKKNLKVLFVASECTPIAKVGGLGDVIGSLPKALKELGVDVRICLPKYQIIDLKKPSTRAKPRARGELGSGLSRTELRSSSGLGAGLVPHRPALSKGCGAGAGYKFDLVVRDIKVKGERVNIYQGFLPESEPRSLRGRVPVYLLENEKYFGENEIYPDLLSFQGIQRFLFFPQAVLEIFSTFKWSPQAIHCHDWHTAILPLLAKLQVKSQKHTPYRNEVSGSGLKVESLLTIHNLSNQGKWNPKEILDFLNLRGNELPTLKLRDKNGDFNVLQQGIFNADLLNTVSPTYAKEILTKEYGEGLEESLFARKKELFGILNGIDEKKFNPKTDPDLKANYSLKNLEKKIENKTHLQEILNFKKSPETPLLAFIGRLDLQKGIDLIIEVIPELIKINCQLINLGVGSSYFEKKLLEFSQKYPQNISSQIKFDPILAQKIYAGADIILMPSKFEPCGLVQMIAITYGTIPIARQTGGLADTIEDDKTGFLFKEYKGIAFLETIKRALKLYQDKEKWQSLMKNAMEKDFSWKISAQKYLKLYQKLLK